MINVNGVAIDESLIGQEMQYHTGESEREVMIKATESLIVSELLKQHAKQRGIATDEHGSFVEELVTADIDYPQATEQECQDYYQHNKRKFTTSPLLELDHILIACPPEDDDARALAREQANELINTLKATPDAFAELARHHSLCPSSELGGNLGQISRGQTVPEFERQVLHCSEGLIPTPIETRYGIHVVCVQHREDGKQLPYEHVAEKIHTYLNEKVRHKAIAQYIATLVDKADIEGFAFTEQDRNFFH